jgi:hypothetical protein
MPIALDLFFEAAMPPRRARSEFHACADSPAKIEYSGIKHREKAVNAVTARPQFPIFRHRA